MPENKKPIYETDLKKVMDQFPDADQAEIREVWDKSGAAERHDPGMSREEMEAALEDVHYRIAPGEPPEGSEKKQKWLFVYSKYLVAAMALLVFGIGYLLVPATYTVPYSETATVELPDGSSVELNSGTTIQYSRLFSFTNRDITLNGEAFFSVEAGEKPFRVDANGTVTEVLGTEFNVRSWDTDPNQKSEVAVTTGAVRFYPEHDMNLSVDLTGGKKAQWSADMVQPEASETTDTDSFTAWRQNGMVFRQAPFIVILNELERRYDIEIQLDAQDMQMETLTAYYTSPVGVESILEDICLVKGLKFSETTGGYRIYK